MNTTTIHGVEYELEEGFTGGGADGADSGPYYHPSEYHPTAPVRCGKCRSTYFRVRQLMGQYETWCDCECGNKFIVHSG